METRDKLIEAARRLLWERGYAATSPKAILDAAGVGQGSMYHHFDGKEALALAAVKRNQEELRAMIEADLAPPGSSVERIERYLLHERHTLNGCRFGKLSQDPDVLASPALSREVAGFFAWLAQRLADVVAEGQAAGELPSGLDPVELGAFVAAAVEGGYVLASGTKEHASFLAAVRGAAALLRHIHHHTGEPL